MEVEDDPWFNQRYQPSIEPLLTRRNSALRSDIYKWWQSLQKDSRASNYNTVVKKLFKVFPDNKQYTDAGPERCRTCAVVGNSGNLLGSHYGALIDFNDFVIRMNRGPTKGFEKDVGSKTTHRIIYPESVVDVDNSTHLVLLPFKTLDLEWLISAFTTKNITRTYVSVKSSVNANKDMVMVIHPAFIKYVYDNWLWKRGVYPSTGFVALVFALHICDEVKVYGFGADNVGSWHHYYEKSRRRYRPGKHSGDAEHEEILQLNIRGKIKLF
ncbi:CMP-N-acetylneuraminate-beta-galactosamide-alpha-2,3-sialyltransferase 1-like [Chanos chanos]|uniref:CMP-N-acetylneuraminate-beta-galactosamide-alpha-2,3-sialyltransferase 1 n=1 Tax=Chanos chanos TaxID=29144 RepID=A0A6J2WL36_CHACN|nr:CMP-N-acetylneuraminate-beta-galactosamide-alpha-2,3-sialyltransferase 1-like [Chanos chanos]